MRAAPRRRRAVLVSLAAAGLLLAACAAPGPGWRELLAEGRTAAEERRFEDAERAWQAAAEAAAQGGEPERAAAIHLRLAKHYEATRRPEPAEREARKALTLLERHAGADAPETLLARESLAWELWRLGRHAESHTLYREVIAALEARGDELGAARARTNLGLALMDDEQLPEAEEIFRRTLEVHVRLLGPDERATAQSRFQLGEVLYRQGRFAPAREELERALAPLERWLGPGDPLVARVHDILAHSYLQLDQPAAAIAHLKQAAEVHGAPRTANAPAFVREMYWLGRAYEALGDDAAAREAYQRLLLIFTRSQGTSPHVVCEALSRLGGVETRLGHLEEAGRLHQRAVELLEVAAAAGMPGEERAEVLQRYALWLRQAGRAEEAARMESRAGAAANAER